MYSSNPIDEQKVSASSIPRASAPSLYNAQPVSGIPIGSTTQRQPSSPTPWSTGLCDCFDDVPNCCITCFCPCITFGQIAEIVDKGSTSCGTSGVLYVLISLVTGCAPIYSCFYRSKLRKQYMLDENPCADCCVHFCCEECALCQEYRELKTRGFDMSIGWEGIVEKQSHEAAVAPVFQVGMTK